MRGLKNVQGLISDFDWIGRLQLLQWYIPEAILAMFTNNTINQPFAVSGANRSQMVGKVLCASCIAQFASLVHMPRWNMVGLAAVKYFSFGLGKCPSEHENTSGPTELNIPCDQSLPWSKRGCNVCQSLHGLPRLAYTNTVSTWRFSLESLHFKSCQALHSWGSHIFLVSLVCVGSLRPMYGFAEAFFLKLLQWHSCSHGCWPPQPCFSHTGSCDRAWPGCRVRWPGVATLTGSAVGRISGHQSPA